MGQSPIRIVHVKVTPEGEHPTTIHYNCSGSKPAVINLKERIEKDYKTSIDKQILSYKGRELSDDSSLEEYWGEVLDLKVAV